jgi:acyl-CoA synthetase (AMP-forming)/AMP-acid ligase II
VAEGEHPLAGRFRDEGWWREGLLTDEVRAWAARRPDALALVDGGLRLTWSQLWGRAVRAAGSLQAAGVRPGDVVSTQLPNGVDIVVLHLAAELAGAVHNPLAVQFREHELDQIGELMRPTLVVHPESADDEVDYAAVHARTAAGRSGRTTGVSAVSGASGGPAIDPGRPPRAASDAAFVLNTSGTVSIKGVVHTHEDALYSTRVVGDMVGLGPDDAVLCVIPMTWGGGLAWGVRIALHRGATLVTARRWDAAQAATLIDTEAISYTYGPPTVARDLVRLADRWRPSRPLTMICAGAPIPRQLCRDARDRLRLSLLPGYGQTEHLHSTLGRLDDPLDKLTETDGSCLPGVELVARDEHGDDCEIGEAGELHCRGPNVAAGYYNQPDLSAATFAADGWQATQDLGAFDRDGYLRVSGRTRDIIIRGGLNVSPREVEELLQRHPDVADVAVVGVPDPRYGERICAFVVPAASSVPTTAELSAALAEMGVARYKHPEVIRRIERLPLTATGKVRHESLRELLRSEAADPA